MTVFRVEDVHVRFAEDDEEVAFAGVFEVVGHVEVGVHARLEDRDTAEFVELRGVGVVVEGAGDQHVEASVGGLAGGFHEIGAGDGAEFGADEDAGAFLYAGVGVALCVGSLGTDEVAGPGSDPGERDAVVFVRLLYAGGFEMVQDHLGEVLLFAVAEPGLGDVVDELVVFIDAQEAVRRQALYGEGAGDADLFFVLVGLVVEVFVVGLGGDGGVDFLLPGDALFPPVRVNSSDLLGPGVIGIAGDFPFLVGCAECVVQLPTQRFQRPLELLPDDVNLGVVGDGLERDVGYALVHETLADVIVGGRFRGCLAASAASLICPSRLSASR